MLWSVATSLWLGFVVTGGANALTGKMTMWTDQPSAILGASCGYADPIATQQGESWQVPYIDQNMYCAVNNAVWNNGQACGRCYAISYSGTGGTNPGRKGNATVQVVNSGASEAFDCYLSAFQKITGANTGIFPVTYAQVPCQATKTTVVVLDGPNAWYVKVLVAGGTRGVQAVKMTVGGKTYAMSRVVGATWSASLVGATGGTAQFVVTYEDGTTKTVSNCFNGWPVAKGKQCSVA